MDLMRNAQAGHETVPGHENLRVFQALRCSDQAIQARLQAISFMDEMTSGRRGPVLTSDPSNHPGERSLPLHETGAPPLYNGPVFPVRVRRCVALAAVLAGGWCLPGWGDPAPQWNEQASAQPLPQWGIVPDGPRWESTAPGPVWAGSAEARPVQWGEPAPQGAQWKEPAAAAPVWQAPVWNGKPAPVTDPRWADKGSPALALPPPQWQDGLPAPAVWQVPKPAVAAKPKPVKVMDSAPVHWEGKKSPAAPAPVTWKTKPPPVASTHWEESAAPAAGAAPREEKRQGTHWERKEEKATVLRPAAPMAPTVREQAPAWDAKRRDAPVPEPAPARVMPADPLPTAQVAPPPRLTPPSVTAPPYPAFARVMEEYYGDLEKLDPADWTMDPWLGLLNEGHLVEHLGWGYPQRMMTVLRVLSMRRQMDKGFDWTELHLRLRRYLLEPVAGLPAPNTQALPHGFKPFADEGKGRFVLGFVDGGDGDWWVWRYDTLHDRLTYVARNLDEFLDDLLIRHLGELETKVASQKGELTQEDKRLALTLGIFMKGMGMSTPTPQDLTLEALKGRAEAMQKAAPNRELLDLVQEFLLHWDGP